MNSSVNTVGIIFVKIDKVMVSKISRELMSFLEKTQVFFIFLKQFTEKDINTNDFTII